MVQLTQIEAAEFFRNPPQHHVEVEGGAVACRSIGTGPDVLFVHGWPVAGATFRKLLPYLTPHVRCHVIDLPGAGQSRFSRESEISIAQHIRSVRAVVDALDMKSVAVVGHDSGGLIARHALAGDPRVRAMALVNTEQPQGLTWRFRRLLWMARLPGFSALLGWAAMQRGLRRSSLLLGDCFAERALIDGEFEEFFLAPIAADPERRWAAGRLARNFDLRFVRELNTVHAAIDVPVMLVWGERDPFFPVSGAEEMVSSFPDARLHVVPEAKLFVHEEFPEEVAGAMLPTLLGQGFEERRRAV